ncbi:MAG: polysulfide reductase NrfD [Planctomycetes bacterium]|nr:polysulfide reductase NrfD [Planctomycetota bacterium]
MKKPDAKTVATGTFLALLTVCTVLGGWAVALRFLEGSDVTNCDSVSPWGLWLSLYLYLIGLSAGSFLISSLVFAFGVKKFEAAGRLALVQALFCLLIGLSLIFIDLGRPERFYRTMFNFNPSSVLSWVIVFYTCYMAVVAVELWILVRPDLDAWGRTAKPRWVRPLYRWAAFSPADGSPLPPWPGAATALKALAITGIPLALCVHGGTGMVFAVMKARPYWYTGLFPLLFVVSALASGGGLLTLLTALFLRIEAEAKRILVRSLARLSAYILLVDLFLLLLESFVAFYGNVPDHAGPYYQILFGPFWWVFWFVQILCGCVIPLVLILGPGKNNLKALAAAAAMIVLGIVGVRLNIVIPPLQTTWGGGLPAEFHEVLSPRGYVPTAVEWLATIGLFSLGAWGLLAARVALPLEPVEGHGAAEAAAAAPSGEGAGNA